MRTSNKILLGGFITTILIIVGIHVALYAKYKSGDMVDLGDRMGGSVTQDLGNIKYVSVIGIDDCTIITADTARMQMDKHWKGSFDLRINGDSLVIDANRKIEDYMNGNRMGSPISLYLPQVEKIQVKYSGVTLLGGHDSANAVSQTIELSNSQLQFATLRENAKDWWNKLTIDAKENVEIKLSNSGMISNLDVALSNNSVLQDLGVHVGSFLLKMDSTSSAAPRMQNLEKLKLNKD